MTVAAVIVPEGVDEAVADATGRPAVRRIVDVAWAGGAMPIVVVTADPDARVDAVLQGSPASLVEPGRASGVETYRLGAEAALAAVQETTAVLLWPGRMTWADPETVTSLLEAHGRTPDRIARPRRAGQAGWPVLVPASAVGTVLAAPGGSIEDALAGLDADAIDLGDPGTVLGREVALDDLPEYTGPPQPVGGPPPEWGAAAADDSELRDDDLPVEGPARD
jgi:CTP:molybdopterin cytidylyltransferase MocA